MEQTAQSLHTQAIPTKTEKTHSVVYLGNFPYLTTEREIRKIFRPYAPIHAVIMITDKNGDSRGYGFIVLEESKAESAIFELDNKIWGGRHLRLSRATGSKRCVFNDDERCFKSCKECPIRVVNSAAERD